MRGNIDSLRRDSESYSRQAVHDGFTCSTCGEIFQKPILATVTSSGNVKTYLACPRCIVKVGSVKTEKSEERRSIIGVSERKETSQKEDFQCAHFLGYLKKRSRDMPVPDECLTCGKMIECMVHQ